MFARLIEFWKISILVLIVPKLGEISQGWTFGFHCLGTFVFSHGHDGLQLSMAGTFGQTGVGHGPRQSSYSYVHVSVGSQTHGRLSCLPLPFQRISLTEFEFVEQWP